MTGKVIASNAGMYTIYADGVNYTVLPKGSLRFKNKFIFVGDDVTFNDDLVISDVLPRKNQIIRPRSSNIDQLFIVMSLVEPELSSELLYKFLTYANMNAIPAKVIFTKADMVKDLSEVITLKNDLEKLNYEVFILDKNDTTEIQKVVHCMKNKLTILMGQTGVGKSSFINKLDSSFERKIGEYSVALGRGKHQTKEVVLLPFNGGFVGDTPGFSSLELDLFKEDLALFFPGFTSLANECFFSNCLHQKEKQCRVKEEIEKGNISKNSYEIYLKLLSTLEYRSQRYDK